MQCVIPFILLILPSLTLVENAGLLNKKVPPYTMLVASGPERGKLHCYVCEQSEKEGVIVFTKKMSEGLSKVAVLIEKQSKARPEFKGWVTLISDDSMQDANLLKWANEHNLAGTPVGRFEYNLARLLIGYLLIVLRRYLFSRQEKFYMH